MGNFIDYLAWRGDLTFDISPFNEVDNLILAQLSYVDFHGIVPTLGEKRMISLREASAMYFRAHSEADILDDKSTTNKTPFLLKAAASSKRFRNAALCKYYEKFDEEKEMQFAALHIRLDDNTTYVSFRGTDDTLIGWKEDFHMAVSTVPSQIAAPLYLERSGYGTRRKLRVGGHSKGGNLAVYAAARCGTGTRDKIIAVYNNDGPGFQNDMLNSTAFNRILPSLLVIQPRSSMIGMLLNQKGRRLIVASSQKGLTQHDAFSWQVLGDHFEVEKSFSKSSVTFHREIQQWLSKYSKERVSSLIDDLFLVMGASGARNLSEVTEKGLRNLKTTMKTITSLSWQSRIEIMEFFRILLFANAAAEVETLGILPLSRKEDDPGFTQLDFN